MSIVDSFLKKMKMVSDDEDYDEDDYDDYDDFDDDEEILSRKPVKQSAKPDPDFDDDDDDDYVPVKKTIPTKTQSSNLYSQPKETSTPASQSSRNSNVVGMKRGNAEVCMIQPKSFDDANTIADILLSHKAVLLNLEGIDMAAAQRIIDFVSGACYTVGGNLQKVSKKIFIVAPPDMNLSGDFDKIASDMVDLYAVNIMQ